VSTGSHSESGLRWLMRSAAVTLRSSRLGLAVMALIVGVGAGLGAVAFRWLILSFTWLATGYRQFGQQGRVPSLHFPGLGIWFLLLIPIVGGILYGPLIQRFAQEARGHGVPEVMLAVAENGGRIRPQVTVVKALASAICIGTGGSVGREGPIVQIGSAFASTLGQWVQMSETRLRTIVACGAAGGIAATFNAPLTGVFFGFEIILREFSIDALFGTILSAVAADLVSRAVFGSAPFFSNLPHNLVVHYDRTYLLIAVLGITSGLLGWGFKSFLYKLEDFGDALWKQRPEWARPAVGGIALGALLLLIPQMYGVGYPVMAKAIAGQYVLWFLIILLFGKILATSLTLSIGGSGGIFAPSLFIGAMEGMAFGSIVEHLFGHVVSNPAVFAVVAMGGVFGAAAQAPLTAIASALEMTGNFTLTVPVMLVVGIATAISKRLSYGSIYTTKLLRRGIDIERPLPTNVLHTMTVADVMQPVGMGTTAVELGASAEGPFRVGHDVHDGWVAWLGQATDLGPLQILFSDETLDQALRQLVLYGRFGLPVLSPDEKYLRGWITRRNVLHAVSERIGSATREAERGTLAAEFSEPDAAARLHKPPKPLRGYDLFEIPISTSSPIVNRRVVEVAWPRGSVLVAISEHHELVAPRTDARLLAGERIVLLAPVAEEGPSGASSDEGPNPGHDSDRGEEHRPE
jgi:chloride channel protein, CIC family